MKLLYELQFSFSAVSVQLSLFNCHVKNSTDEDFSNPSLMLILCVRLAIKKGYLENKQTSKKANAALQHLRAVNYW